MLTDGSGNWPGWVDFWNSVGSGIQNFTEALITSIEIEVGIGLGFGFDLSNNITAEISRDTYVGLDDGEFITGNVITAEMSLFDSAISIGDSYNHLVEKGGKRISSSGTALDGPFDMIFYPDVTHGNQWSILFLAQNSAGDYLVSLSAGAHLGGGGHASVAFNVSEFLRRLTKNENI